MPRVCQALMGQGVSGRLDRDHGLLQRAIVDGDGGIDDFSSRQIAAVDGHLRFLAQLDDRREYRIDPWRRGDGQAVEVIEPPWV